MTNCEQDIDLWNAFLKDDREALGKLFALYYSTLYQYGIKICQDTSIAEDAIQELFIDLWQKKTPPPLLSVKAYLLQAIKFKLYKNFRNTKETTSFDEKNEQVFELSHLSFLIAQEEDTQKGRRILNALNQLAPRQKEVIYLKIYKELSYEEVSSIMQINYQVVRNLLCQALKNLRNLVVVNV
ncbi:MAG TPA: sigma-70 family RNA polymerase sigma factor [Flavisolibacter sp.]|nr:sigma-70 family RNA polymerase sigma factor [Flavisolibacter sp.]